MQSEIAVLRFGLGARPGELKDAAADPRGWLDKQLRGPVNLSATQSLTPSDQILTAYVTAREERKQAKNAANDPDVANVFKAVDRKSTRLNSSHRH